MAKINRFNVILLLLYAMIFMGTFSIMVFLKILTPAHYLENYINENFYVLVGVISFSGLISLKYFISSSRVSRINAKRRVYIFGIISLILFAVIKFFLLQTFYGPFFFISFMFLLTIFDIGIIYLYFGYYKAKNNGTQTLDEIEKRRDSQHHKAIIRTKHEIVEEFIGKDVSEWMNKLVDIDSQRTAIYATSKILSIELLPNYDRTVIINLRKINEFNRINKFFESVNEKLANEGLFVGVAETIDGRHKRIKNEYLFPFNYIFLVYDFIVNRIMPKVKLTQDLYFSYAKNANRAISKAEVLGRLYSCGFELADAVYFDDYLWFCVKKIKLPLYDNNPTYGPFIGLKRVGKDKKIVQIYKMRTMYPYSEFIQKYVYDKTGTKNGDKAENDFRITSWGHFFRRIWLDEFPMFINLFKGDVKIVGVRPLSKAKFDTYPKYLQDKRTLSKPGLVPPFYADMPQTQQELFESESRYLDAYFKAPLRTDVCYFLKAMYNIVIRRARSK